MFYCGRVLVSQLVVCHVIMFLKFDRYSQCYKKVRKIALTKLWVQRTSTKNVCKKCTTNIKMCKKMQKIAKTWQNCAKMSKISNSRGSSYMLSWRMCLKLWNINLELALTLLCINGTWIVWHSRLALRKLQNTFYLYNLPWKYQLYSSSYKIRTKTTIN